MSLTFYESPRLVSVTWALSLSNETQNKQKNDSKTKMKRNRNKPHGLLQIREQRIIVEDMNAIATIRYWVVLSDSPLRTAVSVDQFWR